MTYQFLIGGEVESLMSSAVFKKQWQDLYDHCPWATSFQSLGYAAIWYQEYGDEYTPILVTSWKSQNNRLEHLFALALNRITNEIVVCGDEQTEYKAWLSVSEDCSEFISRCLSDIKRISDGKCFVLDYVPSRLLSTVENLKQHNIHCSIEYEKNAIVNLNSEPAPWASLKKKSNKTRISRLRKQGEIRLESYGFNNSNTECKISSYELLSEMKDSYDIRQGAINGVLPFKEDVRKIVFFSRLLEELENFKSVSIYVGDKHLASLLGSIDKDKRMTNCIICHDPLHAKHSPGKLLVYIASEFLQKEGIKYIDLTPGDDWKQRFSNYEEDVGVVRFYLNQIAFWTEKSLDYTRNLSKVILSRSGVNPRGLRSKIRVSKQKVMNKLSYTSHFLSQSEKTVSLYALPVARALAFDVKPVFHCNELTDLLHFEPNQEYQNNQQFLKATMDKIQAGDICYTFVDNGHLRYLYWLCLSQKHSDFFDYDAPCNVIQCHYIDVDFSPSFNSDALFHGLMQVAKDAALKTEQAFIYICLIESGIDEDYLLKQLGFEKVVRFTEPLNRYGQSEPKKITGLTLGDKAPYVKV